MDTNLRELPSIDDACSRSFVYRDFIECGKTWLSSGVNNVPAQYQSYLSLKHLANTVLEPVVSHFGAIELTYGMATGDLIKNIKRGIAPRLDQHASHELSAAGKRICDREGAACDFRVQGVDSLVVAQWLVANTSFDRMYYYGGDRPIHVSAAVDPKGQCVLIRRDPSSGRVIPSVISAKNFLEMKSNQGGEI